MGGLIYLLQPKEEGLILYGICFNLSFYFKIFKILAKAEIILGKVKQARKTLFKAIAIEEID